MIPFYHKVIALVVAGVASILAYTFWFSANENKPEELGKQKTEEKNPKEIVKEKPKEIERNKEKVKENNVIKQPENAIKKEESAPPEEKSKEKEEDIKTCKSIRKDLSKEKEEEAKTCASLRASSPPQMAAQKTGDVHTNAEKVAQKGSDTSVDRQKSAATLLQELKDSSAQSTVAAATKTTDTVSVSPIVPPVTPTPESITVPTSTISVTTNKNGIPLEAEKKESVSAIGKSGISVEAQKKESVSAIAEPTAPPLPPPSKEVAGTGVPMGSRETEMPSTSMTAPATPSPAQKPTVSAPTQSSETSIYADPKIADGRSQMAAIPSKSATSLTAVSSEFEVTANGTTKAKTMRIHQCFCRPHGKSKTTADDECLFDKKIKPRLLPTEIHPISYTQHYPANLIKPITKKETSLAKEILEKPKKEKSDYLTVFSPVLNAVAYAHFHATMLEDLVSNKDFFE